MQQHCNDTDDDVYMTRHAARADREAKYYSWQPLPGRARDDTELSARGLVATQQLAARFQNVPLAHIVSSPFYRCLQTVAPIAKAKGLTIKVEPGICEVLTTFPPGFWDTPRLAGVDNNTDDFDNDHDADDSIPIDLSYQPIMTRDQLQPELHDGDAAARAKAVAKRCRAQLDGPILFCGHGASCLGMAQAFGAQQGYVGYTSVSHFQKEPEDDGSWRVVQFGNVSHLANDLQRQSLDSAW